jgi:hypothetical protein
MKRFAIYLAGMLCAVADAHSQSTPVPTRPIVPPPVIAPIPTPPKIPDLRIPKDQEFDLRGGSPPLERKMRVETECSVSEKKCALDKCSLRNNNTASECIRGLGSVDRKNCIEALLDMLR